MNNFIFLKNSYFETFGDKNLMKNKETVNGTLHGRPCFITIVEERTGIKWVVPISSQVEKYKRIYEKKRKPCDTLVFGYVMGKRKAFLIQNMCPVIDKYIEEIYIEKKTNKPVSISNTLSTELEIKAKKVLDLYFQGIKVIFPDVYKIRESLLSELQNKTINELKVKNTEKENIPIEKTR